MKKISKFLPLILLFLFIACSPKNEDVIKKICQNLVEATHLTVNDCQPSGRIGDDIRAIFEVDVVSKDFVQDGMSQISLVENTILPFDCEGHSNAETKGIRTYTVYGVNKNLLGIYEYLIRFDFCDETLIQISFSE
jgi:hypothetical protein